MKSQIEIIDSDILYINKDKLKLIDYWKSIIDIELGWHYDMDIIWLLNCIEVLKLSPKSVVMDAGAGNGLIQFILASKGFNVLSIDFADRDFPTNATKLFKMQQQVSGEVKSDNPYQQFIHHKKYRIKLNYKNFKKALKMPTKAAKFITHKVWQRIKPSVLREILGSNRKRYGTITYVKSDFSNMKEFKNESIDCLISVSAIEHGEPSLTKKAIREFERILKKKSYMLITTSAAKDRDWFHEPSKGWCFTEQSLKEIFSMEEFEDNYDQYDYLFDKLKASDLIKSRISRIYFESGDNGLPWGIYDPKYQPVGIVKKVM